MKPLDMQWGSAYSPALVRLPENIREYFRAQGKIGAAKRIKLQSPEQRSAIARNAAQTRWAKERKTTKQAKKRR